MCSIANRKLFSDYGFMIQVQNTIPTGGFVEVVFPSQYRQYLGIPLYPQCNVPCTRSINKVVFSFPNGLAAGTRRNESNPETYLEIKDIINPDTKGGTGNFQVRSIKGSNVIDENLIFGTIGMGEVPNTLTSTSVIYDPIGSTSAAGKATKLIFRFKTVSFIPKSSYFRITMPLGQGYSATATPLCQFLPVLGQMPSGTTTCTFSAGVVIMSGLASDISSGSVLNIQLSVTNPPQTVTGPLFRVEILRSNTQYIYDWVDKLVGPDVTAGQLTGISMTPAASLTELSRGKTDAVTLTFSLGNPIPLGGMIQVTIPDALGFLDLKNFEKPTTYYVLSGLTDANATTPVRLQYMEETAL